MEALWLKLASCGVGLQESCLLVCNESRLSYIYRSFPWGFGSISQNMWVKCYHGDNRRQNAGSTNRLPLWRIIFAILAHGTRYDICCTRTHLDQSMCGFGHQVSGQTPSILSTNHLHATSEVFLMVSSSILLTAR